MSSTVQVLCPNGRRQTVKTTPNTKLLQILEEVCMKQGFSANDHELVSGRKILDVTMILRYSGLPNHAKLELRKSKNERAESDVTVALALESGDRLTHAFVPSQSLYDVLVHWEEQQPDTLKSSLTQGPEGTHPVCIYMREEVIGVEALKETTIRKLGLTGGRMMLRLTHRPVDDETLKNVKENIEKEKTKLLKLTGKQKTPAAIAHSSSVNKKTAMPVTDIADVQSSNTLLENRQQLKSNDSKSAQKVTKSYEDMDICRADSDAHIQTGTSATLQRESPMETDTDKQYSSPSENQTCDNREMKTDSDSREIVIAGQVIRSQAQLEEVMTEMLRSEAAAMAREAARPVLNPIEEQAAPVSKPLQPCPRETVLYNLDDVSTESKASVDPGDDFFDVTEVDVKRMMIDLQKKCENLSDRPMLTKAMRERMMEERASKYTHVFIRVQFSDRNVLQGAFRPQESVGALYKFVSDHLQDKSLKFYLYTSPPRQVIKDKNKSLIQADLVPLTVVYFGVESAASSPTVGYLSSAVLTEISKPEAADEIVCKHMPRQDNYRGKSSAESREPSSSKRQRNNASSKPTNTSEGKKLPKWFNMGKK